MADDGGQGTGAGDRRVRLGDAGVTVIAPTRRADGTWRKARRVREGYVPPDEVASYQAAPARVRCVGSCVVGCSCMCMCSTTHRHAMSRRPHTLHTYRSVPSVLQPALWVLRHERCAVVVQRPLGVPGWRRRCQGRR